MLVPFPLSTVLDVFPLPLQIHSPPFSILLCVLEDWLVLDSFTRLTFPLVSVWIRLMENTSGRARGRKVKWDICWDIYCPSFFPGGCRKLMRSLKERSQEALSMEASLSPLLGAASSCCPFRPEVIPPPHPSQYFIISSYSLPHLCK